MAGHIFVSYSRADQDYVNRLVQYLSEHQIATWVDHEIDYGARWVVAVRDKIDTCAAFVSVMSPTAEASDWVNREIDRAEEMGRPIRPLLLDGGRFFRLSNLQYEDVRGAVLPRARFIEDLRSIVTGTNGTAGPPIPAQEAVGVSRHDTTYGVEIIDVSADEVLLTVTFEARGPDNLRRPEFASVEVTGPGVSYMLSPVKVELTHNVPGHYAGNLSFPYVLPGTYTFHYSSAAGGVQLGGSDTPTVGVSRYSDRYFAVVRRSWREPEGVAISFAAHGAEDLRDPETSVLETGYEIIPATVYIDREWSGPNRLITGTMIFPGGVSGAFRYSGFDDYSPVGV
jgi:hypothetical protein